MRVQGSFWVQTCQYIDFNLFLLCPFVLFFGWLHWKGCRSGQTALQNSCHGEEILTSRCDSWSVGAANCNLSERPNLHGIEGKWEAILKEMPLPWLVTKWAIIRVIYHQMDGTTRPIKIKSTIDKIWIARVEINEILLLPTMI